MIRTSSQRCRGAGRPPQSLLNTNDNLNFPRLTLLLGLQKEAPEDSEINDPQRQCQT